MSKYTEQITTSGEVINVRPNYRNRTFSIKTETGKYRTYPMSQEEFDSEETNTANDWKQFLKTDSYYKL